MRLALEYEQKMGFSVPPINNSFKSNPQPANPTLVPRNIATNQNPSRSKTRPWDVEKQNCITRGLCFRCNEKFASLTLVEQKELDPMEEKVAEEDDTAEISFHAILGKSSYATMKLQGTLNGRHVLILVDSGSTHNFVSEKLVEELQLQAQAVPSFGVQIGKGQVITCNQLCPNLVVHLPGLTNYPRLLPFFHWGCRFGTRHQVIGFLKNSAS